MPLSPADPRSPEEPTPTLQTTRPLGRPSPGTAPCRPAPVAARPHLPAETEQTPQTQDLELSALVYLLARAAQAPHDPMGQRLAVLYLERVAAQGDTPPLMRRTTQHLARLWRGGVAADLHAAAAAR